MKKLALLAFAIIATGAGVAQAAPTDTPIGSADVSNPSYIVVLDGNTFPADGWIGVAQDGSCHGSLTGGTAEPTADNVCGVPE